MFRRELDEPAAGEFAGLDQDARKALADFMDAAVVVDPAEYQRHPGEPSRSLRTLPFDPHSQGLATFLICPPDDLDLVVKCGHPAWPGVAGRGPASSFPRPTSLAAACDRRSLAPRLALRSGDLQLLRT